MSGRSRRSPSPGAVRRGHGTTGSGDALGLALLAPAAVGVALVILLLSRGVDSRATTQNAAEAAAQAAARERSFVEAQQSASRVARSMLTDPATCADPSVAIDASPAFVPGATVSATVTCGTSTAGLELVGASGGKAAATAFAVIDRFRGVDP